MDKRVSSRAIIIEMIVYLLYLEEKEKMGEDNYYEIKWLKLNEIEKYALSSIDKIKMVINGEYI